MSKTLARNVTVEGTTYPKGTKLSDMEDGHADLVTNPKAFDEVEDVEGAENLPAEGGVYGDSDVWTVERLKQEIDQRNGDGRADDAKLAKTGKRADLVARLEADDQPA